MKGILVLLKSLKCGNAVDEKWDRTPPDGRLRVCQGILDPKLKFDSKP